MEKIQGQLGYLQLNEEGAVISSSGDLQNDEKTANVIMSLLTMCNHNDVFPGIGDDTFKRLTIAYDTHAYVVCLSNRKVHILKRLHDAQPNQAQMDSIFDIL